ncbi:MAG TPA: mevalonate kinase [Bacteroidetes bacterium]|nr:mevalonate kinase [Bacteroidota bacterium]
MYKVNAGCHYFCAFILNVDFDNFLLILMKKYPAKLLLFGEHTVNLGSQALATPLPLFSGHWDFSENKNEWAGRLLEFAGYLNKAPLFINLDINRFKKELSEGLFFNSNIPTGYGAGSSGALVAAIFDRYCMVREGRDLILLKKVFAQMESFFHGTSSGTDPLVCYLNKAVILNKKEIKTTVLPEMQLPFKLFLLDTGIKRQATPYIEYFLEKNKGVYFNKKIKKNYLPAVDSAIDCFINKKWESLFSEFNIISEFQYLYLKKMIPDKFNKIWKEGLESGYFKLKICGAGGGGFVLGMTNDFEKLKSEHDGLCFLKIPGNDVL